jgi:hypothetical protein
MQKPFSASWLLSSCQLDAVIRAIRKNRPNLQVSVLFAGGIAEDLAESVRLRVYLVSTVRTLFSYQNGSTRRYRFGGRFFVSRWQQGK